MRNEQFERELELYYKKVRGLLVGSRKQKDKMMLALRSDVDEFVERNFVTEIGDVQEHFGTPQTLGDEMVATMEPQELRKYVKKIAYSQVITAILAALILGAGITMAIQKICYAAYGNPIVIVEKPMEHEFIPKPPKE